MATKIRIKMTLKAMGPPFDAVPCWMYGCLSCLTTTVADDEDEADAEEDERAAEGGTEVGPGDVDVDGGGGGGGGGGGITPPGIYYMYDSVRKKNKSENSIHRPKKNQCRSMMMGMREATMMMKRMGG